MANVTTAVDVELQRFHPTCWLGSAGARGEQLASRADGDGRTSRPPRCEPPVTQPAATRAVSRPSSRERWTAIESISETSSPRPRQLSRRQQGQPDHRWRRATRSPSSRVRDLTTDLSTELGRGPTNQPRHRAPSTPARCSGRRRDHAASFASREIVLLTQRQAQRQRRDHPCTVLPERISSQARARRQTSLGSARRDPGHRRPAHQDRRHPGPWTSRWPPLRANGLLLARNSSRVRQARESDDALQFSHAGQLAPGRAGPARQRRPAQDLKDERGRPAALGYRGCLFLSSLWGADQPDPDHPAGSPRFLLDRTNPPRPRCGGCADGAARRGDTCGYRRRSDQIERERPRTPSSTLPPVLPADARVGPETREVAQGARRADRAKRSGWPPRRCGCASPSMRPSSACRGAARRWSRSSWPSSTSWRAPRRTPYQLRNLFRLDHLAARMRRYNDNLLVLAGSAVRTRSDRAGERWLTCSVRPPREMEQYRTRSSPAVRAGRRSPAPRRVV